MSNRHKSTDDYRYGFNGKEKDDELKGEGNSLDFGARMYDSSVGRFLSLDPFFKQFPFEGSFNFVSNSTLLYKNPSGKAKILTLNIFNEKTKETTLVSFVISENDFEARVSEYDNLMVPKEYSWHDINVIQDVRIDKNGKYIFGKSKTILFR